MLPEVSLGLWQNFGDENRSRTSARSCAAPSTWGSPTSTWPTTTALRMVRPRSTSAGSDAGGFPPLPRRADHLDQGGVRHVAGALRRPRLAQVPAGQPGSVAAPDGPGVRRHLLLPPVRPGYAARGDDGRAGHRGPLGQGPVRGHLLLFRRTDPGRDIPAPADGHAAAHPPAVLLDAEPVDRGRAARRARPGGRRLHRLLAAGPGRADRQVPGRGAGRVTGRAERLAIVRSDFRTDPGSRSRAGRDRRVPGPVPGPARAVLGAAGPAGDLGSHRRQQRRAAGGEPRRGRPSTSFTDDELAAIDRDAVEAGINIWAASSAH